MYRRFDPVRGFEHFARRVNDFVEDANKGFSVEFGSFQPKVDIAEDEKNLFLHAEMPGVKKEDVKVTINEENILLIKGEKKREFDSAKSIVRNERGFGSFARSFALPENILTDKIEAKFENGVLFITLTKKEPEKPREVEINIS
ncbi:MAG: Hsp20/alpha crystallin family protein [Bacteroidota bacterium]